MWLATQKGKISVFEVLAVCGPVSHRRNHRRIYLHRGTTYANKFREPAVASDDGDYETAV